MTKQLGKTKQKVKIKTYIPPVVATVFFIAVIFTLSLGVNLTNLMGNSVSSNYICPDGYSLYNNSCKLEITATEIGDVNKDGVVDKNDIDSINDYLNGNVFLVSDKFKAADTNQDGKISIEDIELIENFIKGMDTLNGYVCPDGYVLNSKKCYITKEAISIKKNNFKLGDAVFYKNSYWYILSDNDDYVTLLRKDSLSASELGQFAEDKNIMYYRDSSCINNNNCNDYNLSDIKRVLDFYVSPFINDLKEVDGYKARLITIDELIKLGFKDKTQTNYFEATSNTPYWIGSNGGEYWAMNSSINSNNHVFTVVDYDNNSYVYESSAYNKLAMVRPVINLYKTNLK